MLNGLLKSLAAGLVICAYGGCSRPDTLPGLVPVSGTVTYKGQPLSSGSIAFVGDGGKSVYSGLITAGQFKLAASPSSPGAAPGEYRVTVKGPSPTMDEKGNPVGITDALPEKFANTATSGLAATVPPDGGELSFDLKP